MNCSGAFTLHSNKEQKMMRDRRLAGIKKGVPERSVVKNIWKSRNNNFILSSSNVELEDSGNLSLKRI